MLASLDGAAFRRLVSIMLCIVGILGSSRGLVPASGTSLGSMDPGDSFSVQAASDAASRDQGLFYSVYRVKKGDTVSGIAFEHGVSIDTIISFNDIQAAKSLRPDQLLKIPSMNGILYDASIGETVQEIASAHEISADRIIETNHLMTETIPVVRTLFLPDARMPSSRLREIAGELFKWPVRGRITSWFGWRSDPFSGNRTFHNAIDIAAPTGTALVASNDGTVTDTGYSPVSGRYVVLKHPGGWSTFYGHMSAISVVPGQRVRQGARIGSVGNTGYSTGPHVHFSVFKNGRAVNPLGVLN